MADLVTRLRLDDKQFNDNIRKSKQQLQNFKQSGKQAGTSLNNTFMSMAKSAGQLAIAYFSVDSAQQAVMKTIRGSQATSDEYDRIVRGMTTSVNNFFMALSTGDFSVFDKGISNVIQKARDAQTALDQLWNTQQSYDYFSAKNQAGFQDALADTRDESLSKEERNAAFERAQSYMQDQAKQTETLIFRTHDAIKKLVSEVHGLDADMFDFLQIEDVFRIDADMNSDTIKNDLTASYEEYKKIKDNLYKKYATKKELTYVDGVGQLRYTIGDTAAYNAELDKLNHTYGDAILYNAILANINDDRYKEMLNLGKAAFTAERQLAQMNRSLVRLKNTQSKQTSGGNDKVPSPTGSLDWYDEQIKEYKAKLGITLDENEYNDIVNKINRLTHEKFVVQMKFAGVKSQEGGSISQQQSLAVAMPDFSNFKIPKIDNPITANDIELNNEYADSLKAIGSIMGSISEATNEGAAAWLTWGANLLTSIAAAIPAIQTMVAAKTAEGAASAGAEAAKTPLVGWLLVGGAIAAALAAFATIPKFAEGGIVDSPFTVGDKNIIRVNGGEMVLTKGQQTNLFNMISGGSGINGGGNVTFTIKGKELVGVLNNYNNKVNRVL